MQMLYNSDQYVVVQFDIPAAADSAAGVRRGGFEIVDKHARREIYIEGAVAESFLAGVQQLSERNPDHEAYDDFIAGFAVLAQHPVMLH